MKHWIWPVCAALSLSCASAPRKRPVASQGMSVTCANEARTAAAGAFTPNSITVLVRAPDGAPTTGVTVRFLQRTQEIAQGTTDATGHYQGVLEPGVYAIHVEADGRATAAEGIALQKDCAISLTLARP
jgi:hypothetical protein